MKEFYIANSSRSLISSQTYDHKEWTIIRREFSEYNERKKDYCFSIQKSRSDDIISEKSFRSRSPFSGKEECWLVDCTTKSDDCLD